MKYSMFGCDTQKTSLFNTAYLLSCHFSIGFLFCALETYYCDRYTALPGAFLCDLQGQSEDQILLQTQAGQLDTTERNMEQIKNQEKQFSNTPTQVGCRGIFQPETQAFYKKLKTKTLRDV